MKDIRQNTCITFVPEHGVDEKMPIGTVVIFLPLQKNRRESLKLRQPCNYARATYVLNNFQEFSLARKSRRLGAQTWKNYN